MLKWDNMCKPKSYGGLGLRKNKLNNLALVSKLGWRIVNENKPLWVKVLKHKYKIPYNPWMWSFKEILITALEKHSQC